MRVVTTREASQLTGISTNKLREWTSRRALIPADIRPKSQGSPAKYLWQTILLLRIVVTLHDGFHIELQAHRQLFASLRRGLRGVSFVDLSGKALAIYADERWAWVDEAEASLPTNDAILIRLTPHLDALSQGFGLPRPSSFPVSSISSRSEPWTKCRLLLACHADQVWLQRARPRGGGSPRE